MTRSVSGTWEHPLNVCALSDAAQSSPSEDSSGTPTADSEWDDNIICTPAAHPDGDSDQFLTDEGVINNDDSLVLSSSGTFVPPASSSDFSLLSPKRGPVGNWAIHQDYLNRAQRLLQDLKARDDLATANIAATVAYIKWILLDDAQFVAGNWHHYADLWAAHLRSIPRWPQRAKVMEWIRQGYPIDWVDPESEVQQTHKSRNGRYKQCSSK